MLRLTLFGFALLATLTAAGDARALSLELGCVTGNSSANCAAGEAQLALDVTLSGSSATFEFTNLGPVASRITDVYFHDALGLFDPSTASLAYVGNVLFTPGAHPSNWGALGFSTDYSWGSQSHDGVDPGESLIITMMLASGGTLTEQDLLRAIFPDGTFNIGIKVGGFPNGGSEGFAPIPEPRAAILFGAGLLVVALAASRRRRLALG
jgi:hypothetical protein